MSIRRSPRAPFITVAVGAAVSVSGCHATDTTPSTGTSQVATGTSTGLPAWSDGTSGHPVGATNPPQPVLNVTRDRSRCFKSWEGGMGPPQDVFQLQLQDEVVWARYVAFAQPRDTEVKCPAGAAAALEAQYSAVAASAATATPSATGSADPEP